MDLKSSIIQGMQTPVPVQQVPEDLVPYLQSLQALKQHESKYKQLDRVKALSKKQEAKMRREIEESKYDYYEGEDKTSSFSPFRKALSIKLAQQPNSPSVSNLNETPLEDIKANPSTVEFDPSSVPLVPEPEYASVDRKTMQPTPSDVRAGVAKAIQSTPDLQSPGSPRDRVQLSLLANSYAQDNALARARQRVSDTNKPLRAQYLKDKAARDAEVNQARALYNKTTKPRLEQEAQQGFASNRAYNINAVKDYNKQLSVEADQEYADQPRRLDKFKADRDTSLADSLYNEFNNRNSPEEIQGFIDRGRYPVHISKLIEERVLPRLENREQSELATRDIKEQQARLDYLDRARDRDTSLADSLYNVFNNRNSPEEIQGFIDRGRYPKHISKLIDERVLPRLDGDRGVRDFELEQAARQRQEEKDTKLKNQRTLDEDAENSSQREIFERRENTELANRFKTKNPYLGDYNDRAVARYDRKPSVPEPSYSQYFSDRLQDAKDYAGEVATGAGRLGSRLLRPITVGMQGLASDAIQNFDFVRDRVDKETADKINEELFYSTGSGDYLDRMGLQEASARELDRLKSSPEKLQEALERNKIRSRYRTNQGAQSLDSYLQSKELEKMEDYDYRRAAPDPEKDPQAYEDYFRDRENFLADTKENLRNYYGVKGNQLGTGSIRTDNPYRDALDFTQDAFSDPRKFLDRAAMGAKETFDDYVTDIPTSSNQVYNQLDANNPLRQFFEPKGLRDPVNDVTAIEQAMKTDPEIQGKLTELYPDSSPSEMSALIGEGLSPGASPILKSKALQAITLLEDQLVRQGPGNQPYFPASEGLSRNPEMTSERETQFKERDELLRNSIAQINSNTKFPQGRTMLDYASKLQGLNQQLTILEPDSLEAQEAENKLISTIEELNPEQANQMLEAMGIVTRTTGRGNQQPAVDIDKLKDDKSLTRYLY